MQTAIAENYRMAHLIRMNMREAKLLLHYICPIISIGGFLLFERRTILTDSERTGMWQSPHVHELYTFFDHYIFVE